MLQTFDVLCVGDAKIDIFFTLPDIESYVYLDKNSNRLCLSHGQKIPVEKCLTMLGGNATNTAIGLAKLGIKTAIVAEIGDDEFSQKIINIFKKYDVSTDFLVREPNTPSSLSAILTFQKERTILGQHLTRRHAFSFENISAKMVYLTSLGEYWKDAYKKTLEFVKKSNAILAFNPGSMQLKAGTDEIKNVLEQTNILFVNKEEAEHILGIKEKKEAVEKDLLLELQKLGVKTAVVTDGKNGSFVLNEKGEYLTQLGIKTEVVEKTGAGDAYASGFLGAFSSGLSLQEAMRWGSLNASGTMKKIGAENGILSREEMESSYAKQSWV